MNFEIYVKSGTTILTDTVYSFNGKAIPDAIRPTKNTLLQGFCCDGDFGDAMQISAYIDKNDGCIKYSTPTSKSYYAVQGFWLLNS